MVKTDEIPKKHVFFTFEPRYLEFGARYQSKNATVGFCTGLLASDPPFYFSHTISVPVQKSRFSFAKSVIFQENSIFHHFPSVFRKNCIWSN